MLLQVSVQDIGQLPYFELRQRSDPSGEMGAERAKAINEAVPRILERLRPKYGRLYSFDDAQPGNIRLLAQSVQPSLANR